MTPAFIHHGGATEEGSEPAVLLLHGAGMDHTVWRGLARHLAHHGRRVLAPDFPGHGRTPGPALESIEEMASWAVRLLKDEGASESTIVGHSMGGLVALRLGAIGGSAVNGLVLVCSATRLDVHSELQHAADARDLKAVELILSWSFGAGGRMGGLSDPGVSALVTCRRVLERGIDLLGSDLRACSEYVGGSDDAAAIRAPSLVVSGSEDRMVRPGLAAALAGILTGARFELVPGGGHMLMVQQPERVRRLVDGMLASGQLLGSRADV
jgi:pimeloyl-ACP methyl ester carboxylesterase